MACVAIEHDLDVIRASDWAVIGLGPGGGRDDGEIMAEGTPREVASSPRR
ncbi:hypothetical protein [Streptosporangium sp. 'caverna']|nr:hypothetical protein [Streptosporangium sp. 'caverna']